MEKFHVEVVGLSFDPEDDPDWMRAPFAAPTPIPSAPPVISPHDRDPSWLGRLMEDRSLRPEIVAGMVLRVSAYPKAAEQWCRSLSKERLAYVVEFATELCAQDPLDLRTWDDIQCLRVVLLTAGASGDDLEWLDGAIRIVSPYFNVGEIEVSEDEMEYYSALWCEEPHQGYLNHGPWAEEG